MTDCQLLREFPDKQIPFWTSKVNGESVFSQNLVTVESNPLLAAIPESPIPNNQGQARLSFSLSFRAEREVTFPPVIWHFTCLCYNRAK